MAKKDMQEFVVPLSEGSRAVFQWPTTLSQEDLDDLKDSLKILERKISRSVAEKSSEAGLGTTILLPQIERLE